MLATPEALKTSLNAIKVKINDVLNLHSDWNISDKDDPRYIENRTHYEEVTVTDISGQKYEIGFSDTTITHNLNIPFELGQVWKAGFGGYESGYECEVQTTDDGTLYIGSIGTSNLPFYITSNEGVVLEAYYNNHYNFSTIFYLQCVSGKVSETVVHTIDEKYLPDSAKTQPDWTVNDESNPAYVKNRTHYSEEGYIAFLSETTLTTETTLFSQTVDFGKMLSLQTVYVKFDGVMYECTVARSSGNYPVYTLESADGQTLPFTVRFDVSSSSGRYIKCTNPPHTIEMLESGTIYHSLAHEYIPEGYLRYDKGNSLTDTQKKTLQRNLDTCRSIKRASFDFDYDDTTGEWNIVGQSMTYDEIQQAVNDGHYICGEVLNAPLLPIYTNSGSKVNGFIGIRNFTSTSDPSLLVVERASTSSEVFESLQTFSLQERLSGTVGQIVGFDANGNAVAVDSLDYLVINSSTAGSTKKFRITVDDNGVLTTEEVSE